MLLGLGSIPGETSGVPLADATMDSRERFYNGIFIGYGLVWIWAARQRPIPPGPVMILAAAMFAGGVGRVVSVLQYGWPHWFQIPLSAVELLLPPVYVWLARRESARGGGARGACAPSHEDGAHLPLTGRRAGTGGSVRRRG